MKWEWTRERRIGTIDLCPSPRYYFVFIMKLDRETIKQVDSQNMLGSIEVFEKQCVDAYATASRLPLPSSFRDVNHVVLFGMGGSALGMHVVQTAFAQKITVPISIVNDYAIPAFVNEHSLVILSSYSGATEEVLTVARDIMTRTKKIIMITTGGELSALATIHHIPAYIFQPQFNPSNQPRMAVGYSILGIVGLFSQLGLLAFSASDMEHAMCTLAMLHKELCPEQEDKNRAKKLARTLENRIPTLVAAEFCEGAAHVMANQINENAKQFSARFAIPEMGHHLIEGFVYPTAGLRELCMVFCQSNLYHERNQKRFHILENIAQKNTIATTFVDLTADTPFEQALELILLGSYTSLYMAVLHDCDPSPIPNVDELKKQLQKSSEENESES